MYLQPYLLAVCRSLLGSDFKTNVLNISIMYSYDQISLMILFGIFRVSRLINNNLDAYEGKRRLESNCVLFNTTLENCTERVP